MAILSIKVAVPVGPLRTALPDNGRQLEHENLVFVFVANLQSLKFLSMLCGIELD